MVRLLKKRYGYGHGVWKDIFPDDKHDKEVFRWDWSMSLYM